MFFRQIHIGNMKNFAYLIGCEESRECAVVDPGFDHDKILSIAQEHQYRITTILLTHFHYDHSGQAEILSGKTGATIYGHKRGKLKRNQVGNWIIPSDFCEIDADEQISIGTLRCTALHTPGHQSDHICYLFGDRIFTGDTLFVNKIGRVDFADGEPQKMKESLERLKQLPDELLVFSGHDYGHVAFRTLGEEKLENPYLTGKMKRWV